MKKKPYRLLLLICATVFLFGTGFQPTNLPGSSMPIAGGEEGLNLLTSSQTGISFKVLVPVEKLQQETIQENGTTYINLSLPGWEQMAEVGAPVLPFRAVTLGVPFGAELTFKVTPGKSHTIKLNAPVLPGPGQVLKENSFMQSGEPSLPEYETQFVMDEGIYHQKDTFPGELAALSNEGVLRGQRLAAVAVYPMQYNPLDNFLTIYEELTVEVQFSGSQTLGSQTSKKDAPVFESMLADTLLNYDLARYWRQPDTSSEIAIQSSPDWEVPTSAWKVIVSEPGFYQLDNMTLAAEGFPVSTVAPANIQMFNQGQEVALDVRLDASNHVESIIFYGQELKSKYTDQNVYWLTVGTQAGLRMSQRSGEPGGSAEIPSSYRREIYVDRLPGVAPLYRQKAPGDDHLDRFLMGMLNPDFTYTFLLEDPDLSETGELTISLLGFNSFSGINPDHHVAFYLNEEYLGEVWFDGITWRTVELTIPPGSLQVGQNTLRFYCPGDTGGISDLVFVDWFRLIISDSFAAMEEGLTFAYETPGTWLYEVDGFDSASLVDVYDISDPQEPVRITDAEFNSGTLHFQDTIDSQTIYQVLGTDAYFTTDASIFFQDVWSDLKNPANQADMIIVSHVDFIDESQTLADYRNGEGVTTVVIDAQDVYDEFNHGIISPYAIRDFLAYTQNGWGGDAPAYVLLVGDGNYDPKNYLGYNRTSYLPPFLAMVDQTMGETAADNRYVTFDGEGDLLPDMLIGRFSVNSAAEATAMVDKIIAYETLGPNSAEWQNQVLFVADNAPSFADTSDYLAENYVTAVGSTVSKVYYGISPHETLALARTAIQAKINAGNLFINFIGHGTVSQWSNDGLLKIADVAALSNNEKVPIVLAMTCYEGYFIFPHPLSSNNEALAEVFTRKASGGALASWSASGAGVATGHFSLNSGFYEAYFYDGVGTLGEATIAGKLALWETGNALDLLDTYHLFGDPSVVFKRGLTAISDDYEVDENDVLTVGLPGVLANDHNPNGLTLNAEIVPDSGPSHGTLDFNPDGSFTYTPEPNWFGLDNFYYRAVEEGGKIQSNPTRVNLVVRSTNQLPVALENTYPAYEDTLLSVSAEDGVLINDTDPDIDTLTAHLYSSPSKGSVILNTDGSFKYYPWYNQNGTDSFTYQAHDGEAFSEAATVTINIAPLNDAPLASDQLVTTVEGTAKEITLIAFDVEGDPLTYSIVAGPTHGTLSGTGFKLTYTPALNYVGDDSFTFKANDGKVDSNIATVSITIIEEPPKNIYLPLILR